MKKALLLIFVSVVITFVVAVLYTVTDFSLSYKPENIEWDSHLTYLSGSFAVELLRKTGYYVKWGVKSKHFERSNTVIDLSIYSTNQLESLFDYYESVNVKDKSIVVLVQTSNESPDFEKQKPFSSSIFKNIRSVYTASQLPSDSILKEMPAGYDYTKMITVNGNIFCLKTMVKGAEVFIIFDPHVFSDYSILKEDNAELLFAITGSNGKNIIVDNKSVNNNKTVNNNNFNFFMIPLLLSLIAFIIVFFINNIRRFGNIPDYDKYKKRSFLIHLRGVGNYLSMRKTEQISTILDAYFYEKLRKITRTEGNDADRMINDILKRYNLDSADYSFIYPIKYNNLIATDNQRVDFIKKLTKGG